jgi:hypothetical protein
MIGAARLDPVVPSAGADAADAADAALRDGGSDAFVDAVLGLDRLCAWLAVVFDEVVAPVLEPPEPEPPELCEPIGSAGPPQPEDDLLDALLGLASLRTTVGLVLGALCEEPAADAGGVELGGRASVGTGVTSSLAWSRDQLR